MIERGCLSGHRKVEYVERSHSFAEFVSLRKTRQEVDGIYARTAYNRIPIHSNLATRPGYTAVGQLGCKSVGQIFDIIDSTIHNLKGLDTETKPLQLNPYTCLAWTMFLLVKRQCAS